MSIRIAMWSGPRNISTAMMRSWENRPDCVTVDEPFYACYLRESGLEHPCREDILSAQSSERGEVVRQLSELEPQAPIFYQKHMTHHMPRGMDMHWCAALRHCFLIRDPAEVIASYLQKMPAVSEDAIGIARQWELFEEIAAITGRAPLVIDSNEVLRHPGAILQSLCEQLDVPYLEDAMLSWPPGRRDSDGVWAPHWYQNVETSTGFASYAAKRVQLPEEHRPLADAMQKYYLRLAEHRIQA
ncbi:MAG: hypothetical protein ABJ308_06655 [Halieaceae bacterium]